MEIKLPNKPIEAKIENPRFMILFGKPKSGKTELASRLENNLIIDLEDGSDFVKGLKIKASNTEELLKIKKAIKEAGNPYEYVTIDTGTALEEMVLPMAKEMYMNTPMGKNFKGDDIRTLPNGGGYLYIRLAFNKILKAFRGITDHLILLAHTKERTINRDGKEMSEHLVDLSGKLGSIISSKADAIGYVYRRKNETRVNFNGGGDFIVEARAPHLRGKDILAMESDENGILTSHWDRIFKK